MLISPAPVLAQLIRQTKLLQLLINPAKLLELPPISSKPEEQKPAFLIRRPLAALINRQKAHPLPAHLISTAQGRAHLIQLPIPVHSHNPLHINQEADQVGLAQHIKPEKTQVACLISRLEMLAPLINQEADQADLAHHIQPDPVHPLLINQ